MYRKFINKALNKTRGMLWVMKRMGIDFGTKKIGIALTDDAGRMAFPHEVVPNDGKFLSYIESLVTQRGVAEIVIGHSLNNDGQANPVHKLVEEFMLDITLSIGIPVHLEPEYYSSQQAMQLQGKNKQIDASAAAIILDSFITKQKN
ncbi:MAG: hypothetical protein RLZZ230_38 [Candidatus Parcubacteria bacterium]|jgi:putative Holliday junction resolvase